MTNNIFDSKFNGMGRSEMYRHQLVPDLFPHEKPMLVENWPADDREAYCGGEWTPGYDEPEARRKREYGYADSHLRLVKEVV